LLRENPQLTSLYEPLEKYISPHAIL
jgi:hypothetical protein